MNGLVIGERNYQNGRLNIEKKFGYARKNLGGAEKVPATQSQMTTTLFNIIFLKKLTDLMTEKFNQFFKICNFSP